MKKILLGLMACIALSANSQTYNFTTAGAAGRFGPTQIQIDAAYAATNLNGLVTINTQGIQEWVVPFTGSYQIQAVGAKGGNSVWGATVIGGNGSSMTGDFNLIAGQVVQILVGQQGETDAIGGGGGASYVAILNVPQIVGGGGGGASSDQGGVASVIVENGTMDSQNIIAGGTLGGGGAACMTFGGNNGGGGGGFFTNGATPNSGGGTETNGYGGLSFLNGGVGGEPGRDDGACSEDPEGGFGGGGSGTCNTVGGGGGGGYSGGGGGPHIGQCGTSLRSGGGGGGSYNAGTNQVNVAGSNAGNGYVVITVLCSPTMITPDQSSLPSVTEECSSTPIAPTATTDCGSVVIGVPDVPFPIITQGPTLVTWTYNDGAGNITSQTQVITITDLTAPVADSPSLADLVDVCGLDVLNAPTATDNCVGQIIGTTTTALPINTAGNSVITWTFDDGNGNVSTQTQNVINPSIDNGVTQVVTQLTADATVSGYQWLNCDNNFSPIVGATNQSYTPTVTGNYAVQLSDNGCVDTSVCILVDFTGLDEMNLLDLTIYPNPSTGMFSLSSSSALVAVEVFDYQGRKMNVDVNLTEGTVNGSNLSVGKYIVKVETALGIGSKELTIMK